MNTATPLPLAGKSALTLASRRAKVSAISAPMLRAAPVTLAYWKFESNSLQERVHCELDRRERDQWSRRSSMPRNPEQPE